LNRFWQPPPPNNDHKVEVIDPNDRRTWKVIKGRKSVEQLLNEMIDDPKGEFDTPTKKTKARNWHRL